jgi:hypothetical protein
MNDERFFDLAMKAIAQQANDAERKDLDAMLADKPELRAELLRLERDALVAKDALPLVAACTESTGQFPAYARERLQTTVRQTLGGLKSGGREPSGGLALPNRGPAWGWRWVLGGLAMATLLVVGFTKHYGVRSNGNPTNGGVVELGQAGGVVESPTLDVSSPTAFVSLVPVIEIAMLDTTGGTRGANNYGVTILEQALLEQTWKGTPVQSFSSVSELQAWEKNWPTNGGRPAARVVYDRASGEVRVSGRSQGRVFQKTFHYSPLAIGRLGPAAARMATSDVERDLTTTLQHAKAFIEEQTER